MPQHSPSPSHPARSAQHGSTLLPDTMPDINQFSADAENVELRLDENGTGDGVLATRQFDAGETIMVGFLTGPLTGNDSHATQVGPDAWARHGGLGTKVNHSCDPNCGVRLNENNAFDFVARKRLSIGEEITFDYAMRNFKIEHFPDACLCGADNCRGQVTGWQDLPQGRKDAYGELVAPYLRQMDADAA